MERPGLLGRMLGLVVGGVVRRAGWVVVVILALAFLAGRYAAGTLGINTDTANMISPSLDWRKDFIAYRDAFPARDRNLVVAVDAADAAVAADAAAALAMALEARPDQFVSVFLAGHGEFFDRNGLLYLSLPELEALSDELVAAQPLIGQLRDGFSGAAVLDLAGTALGSATGEEADSLDPLLGALATVFETSVAGHAEPISWRSVIGADATANATRQLLLVRPVLDFTRVQPALEPIAAIRALSETIGAQYGDSVRVRLTGTVAMEHEELQSVVRSASTAGIAALVMVIVVLIWALRSIVLLVVSIVTLLTGLVFTAAFAAVAVGHLNLISVAFAVLYVGLGVDFILHICLRMKELIAAGHDTVTGLVETAQGVGASLVICAVTTAAGFYAFIPTDFDGVSELGMISGSGMFISLIVTITLLPALLKLVWRPRPGAVSGVATHLQVPHVRARNRRGAAIAIVTIAVAVGVAALVAVPHVEFDSNPIHLRNPESESIVLLDELADSSEAPLFSMVAIADDAADSARWADGLSDEPLVERVITTKALVPEDQDEKLLVLDDLRFVLGSGFADLDPRAFDEHALMASADTLLTVLEASSVPTPEASRLRAAIERWRQRLPADTAERADFLGAIDRAVRADLPEQLDRLEQLLATTGFDRDDLPAELRERWIDSDGHELVEFVPIEDLNDNAAAARFVGVIRAVAPRATGLPVVYQEASRTIVSAFSQALLYALIMVAALLLLLLRRLGDTLLVLGPILFAAVVTAGVAVLIDLPFNFANIIALPLLIGVGVDNGIHLVHRMRSEPPAHGNAYETSTSRAVLASGLTTIASFGNLAFSEHVGMSSMGQLLTVGMLVTLAATLVLLPALLELRRAQ